MGLRLYRRIRLLPGVRLNLTLHGASLSFGHAGAWYTVNRRGRRATLGWAGTGLRASTYTSTARPGSPRQGEPPAPSALRGLGVVLLVLLAAIALARVLTSL